MNVRSTSLPRIAAATLLVALAGTLTPAPATAATESRLRVEVLVDGVPIREYRGRGTTYVEAQRGREYSIRLTNLEPVRVAVALAVDGRNTIDASRTSAREARKWILEPWQSQTIRGWQVDGSRARRFYFTTEDRSYAEWLGDTRNVGVIEAVAFREEWPEHRVSRGNEPWEDRERNGDWRDGRRDDGPSWGREKSAEAARPASPPGESAARSGGVAQGSARAERQSRDASADEAATGIGRDVGNGVVRVEFSHEDWAASTVKLRYGFREELEKLGVVRREEPEPWWPWRREQATGFEAEAWCPEPGRGR